MTLTYSISAYCSRCKEHVHLTLTGTEQDVRARRDSWVCSDCIIKEVA